MTNRETDPPACPYYCAEDYLDGVTWPWCWESPRPGTVLKLAKCDAIEACGVEVVELGRVA